VPLFTGDTRDRDFSMRTPSCDVDSTDKQPLTVEDEGGSRTPLGSRLAARFAGIGLDEKIPELRDQPARPGFEPSTPSTSSRP
jgi:hypothetical protein